MSNKTLDTKEKQLKKGNVDITEFMNPFPGLRPFGMEESHLFFGREGQSEEVLLKLSENKFVSILGTSGSGKSSLMYCGLIPNIYGGFLSDVGTNWKIVVLRPGVSPIDNLAEGLLMKSKAYLGLSEEDKLIKKTITSTVLRSSSLGLSEVIEQLKEEEGENILIVVDQFEEIFRFKKLESKESSLEESSAFVNLLLEAINDENQSLYVTLTMRSDFIGECAQFPELTQLINDSHYLIPQMTREQKRHVIEGPVVVGGGKISARLTQQLLNDIGDNPDQLPILQHALMRTWSYWVENRREDESMDLRHYNAIGTVKQALSLHANEAFDSLSKREKEICETMFKSLTEKGRENQGTRRPTKLSTIAAIAGVQEDEVVRVVERFREPRRSLLMPPAGVALTSDTVIDISHESLMRIWVRLKRWLEEEANSAEVYTNLSESAQRYQEGKSGLLQMPDLQLAINWKKGNNPTLVWGQRYNPAFERTMVFLATSERAYLTEQRNKEILQKRQIKRMRTMVIVVTLAFLIVVLFLVYAFNQTILAQSNLEEAQKQEQQALANLNDANEARARADANAEEAARNAEQARLAAERADTERKKAEAARKQAESSRKSAEENLLLAQQREKEAQAATEEAKIQEEKAQENAKIADEQRKNAENLRYQAVAQSMAIKAQNLESATNDEAELRAIVAKQAYLFYDEHKDEGKDYNGEIYAGIYKAVQGLYAMKFPDSKAKGDSAFNMYSKPQVVDAEHQVVGAKSVVHSKNSETFYSANADGSITMWDVDTRNHLDIYKGTDVARVLHLSDDENYLAVGTEESDILLIDLRDVNREPVVIKGHPNGIIYDLKFVPNSTDLISVGPGGKILYSDFNNTTELATLAATVTKLAISPDAKTLAVGSISGKVYLFDINGKSITSKSTPVDHHASITSLAYSPDGTFLAVGDNLGEIQVWKIKGENLGELKPNFQGLKATVTDIEFDPTGRLLVASTTNAQVRIWDLDHRFDLPTVLDDYSVIDNHGWVNDVEFSEDGSYFLTAAGDGNIRKYPRKIDELADEICSLLKEKGNLSDNEWRQYVGQAIDYEAACEQKGKRSDDRQ